MRQESQLSRRLYPVQPHISYYFLSLFSPRRHIIFIFFLYLALEMSRAGGRLIRIFKIGSLVRGPKFRTCSSSYRRENPVLGTSVVGGNSL